MVYEQGQNPDETLEYQSQLYGLPLVPSGEVSEDLEHSEGFSSNPAMQSFTGRIAGLGTEAQADPQTQQYGLGVRTTGQPDTKAAVYGQDGAIEYYDF